METKKVKKNLTYKTVSKKLFNKNKYCFYISEKGKIEKNTLEDSITNKNGATNKKQLKKLLALNQLLNIAEYYNTLHPTIIHSNTIMYDGINQTYTTSQVSTMYLRGIKAIFNRAEDAQAVIDNHNFRKILDTIYKN